MRTGRNLSGAEIRITRNMVASGAPERNLKAETLRKKLGSKKIRAGSSGTEIVGFL
jgi:hypothetical protein